MDNWMGKQDRWKIYIYIVRDIYLRSLFSAEWWLLYLCRKRLLISCFFRVSQLAGGVAIVRVSRVFSILKCVLLQL